MKPRADSRYKQYFVRSGTVLTTHTVGDATHAVWAFFRKAVKMDRVDELGDFIGISRRGFEDEGMLWSLTVGHLYVNEDTKRVLFPPRRSDMPREVGEPEGDTKDKHARWRQKCASEGRCTRCGGKHDGPWLFCETCREKKKSYHKSAAVCEQTPIPQKHKQPVIQQQAAQEQAMVDKPEQAQQSAKPQPKVPTPEQSAALTAAIRTTRVNEDDDDLLHASGPVAWCPDCEAMVHLPCVACRARAATERPMEHWEPDVDCDLALSEEDRQAYEEVKAGHLAYIRRMRKRRYGHNQGTIE